jgi:hypothetical protein
MTTPPNGDSELSRLLDDAVADVHPQGGTGQIRGRARRTASAGRWVPLTLAAAVATVLVIVGAAWLAERDPSGTPAAEPGAPSRAASPEPDPGRTLEVPVYYVGDTAIGPRLFAERHTLEGVTGTDLEVAVQEALGGPPQDPDYTAWTPVDGLAARATTNGTTITIDLSEPLQRSPGMNDEAANVALQSLVWTADAVTGTEQPVQFTVDGAPVDQVLGIDTTAPISRASADSVLSTVSITSPAEGDTVSTRFDVTGQAATFEANVVWELKQGDTVVRNGFTTAQECCTLSPYTFTATAAPGDYTLTVHDTDESDGEGVGTSEDTKRITVE